MNENEVLQMMDQLEVEHNNALSRWNELRRWLEYRLQQQAAQQSVSRVAENEAECECPNSVYPTGNCVNCGLPPRGSR